MTPTATKSELARALKIHRAQLDAFLAKPGAPSPDKKKKYDSKAVAAFIAESRGAGSLDTLREARLEEVRLRCERLRRELDRDAKLTVLRSDLEVLFGKMALNLRGLLYAKLQEELPAKCAGYDALALRKHGREVADEIVGRLAGDVNSWVPA